MVIKKSGNYFFNRRQSKHLQGTGFYIYGSVTNKMRTVEAIFERISYLKRIIENGVLLTVIQMYAATIQAEADEIERVHPKECHNKISTLT